MSALVIDAFEYARLKEHRNGKLLLADLSRLRKETVESGSGAAIEWDLRGDADALGHARLTLRIGGIVKLTCQRCLSPLDFDVTNEAVLILAKDEDHADQIDALLANDELDVIVGSRAMSVIELVEDEALLAIPLSVRHDICPDALVANDGSSKRPSPFAALKELKRE